MAKLLLFFGLPAIIFAIVAVDIVFDLLGKKCRQCGSRRTFTWIHYTADASLGSDKMHRNVNRYCFKCFEFTERADHARIIGGLESSPFYKLACSHKRKHCKENHSS